MGVWYKKPYKKKYSRCVWNIFFVILLCFAMFLLSCVISILLNDSTMESKIVYVFLIVSCGVAVLISIIMLVIINIKNPSNRLYRFRQKFMKTVTKKTGRGGVSSDSVKRRDK